MKVLDNAKLSSVAGGGLFQLGPGNILMPIRFWFKTEEDLHSSPKQQKPIGMGGVLSSTFFNLLTLLF